MGFDGGPMHVLIRVFLHILESEPWWTSPWLRCSVSRRPTMSESRKVVWIVYASGRDDRIPPIANWHCLRPRARDQQDHLSLYLFTDGGYSTEGRSILLDCHRVIPLCLLASALTVAPALPRPARIRTA